MSSSHDDHSENRDTIDGRVQLTTPGTDRDDENSMVVGRSELGPVPVVDSLVVGSPSTLETHGESPRCMYHLMSPTVSASTPVDPRFSSEKPPRVRMILPELNRGTDC